MPRLLAAALVACFLAPHMLVAQTPAAGARIRVARPKAEWRVGTLIALANDTLVVRWADDSATARLPVAQVSRMDVSRGSERRIMSRLGRGLVIGAAAGAFLGVVGGALEDCEGELFCIGPAGGAVIGATAFGVTGAVIGAVTGLRPSERWERARLNSGRVALLLPTRRDGQAIGLAVAF